MILNSPSFADSIHAIIDLQATYLLMQQGGAKSSQFVGSMPQYIPESMKAHAEYTHYLISLLPGDKKSPGTPGTISGLKHGELLQNSPNPFKTSTNIWYKLENESRVIITIYDCAGRSLKTINQGTKSEGNHSFEFNASGLAPGIYFYTLELNGTISDSKKMTVLK
ncbi:MAG: T9SS type A sorting domain-containing protein [Bacteroidales bacterium]|nr:T9SS type A sorting domain-containing protein [Bacteroidales bacterium]MCF8403505.1 T9SS type A sorting domain-containing protein [Bacteroidales bacterium]